MFDPYGKTSDPEDATQDDCRSRNNQHFSIPPTLSSSRQSNVSRKRKLPTPEDSTAGGQQQQQQQHNQTSSIQEFPPPPPPAGMPINNNSNLSNGITMDGGILGNRSHLFNSSSSPLGQDLAPSVVEANAVTGSAQLPSSLVDTMAIGSSTTFGQGLVAEHASSSMISANDPLQRLLQQSFPPSDGCASNNYIVHNGNIDNNSDSKMTVIQRKSNNVSDDLNQFLTLSQQRSNTSTIPNNVHFQLGNPSPSSNFSTNKQMLQNLQSCTPRSSSS